jgi:hypothetical protein
MLSGFLGYALGMCSHLVEEDLHGVFPVEELPQVDAGGAQAETMTAIGVEENSPVVKLLPEHDERIPYGSFMVVHGSASRFPTIIAHTEANLSEDMQQLLATWVPGSRRIIDYDL